MKRGSIKCTAATSAALIPKVKTTKGKQRIETTLDGMKSNRDEKQRFLGALDVSESQYKALAADIPDHTSTKLSREREIGEGAIKVNMKI